MTCEKKGKSRHAPALKKGTHQRAQAVLWRDLPSSLASETSSESQREYRTQKKGINSWLKTLSRKFLQRPVLLQACPHETSVQGLSLTVLDLPERDVQVQDILVVGDFREAEQRRNFGWSQHDDMLCGYVHRALASAVHVMLSPTSSTLLPHGSQAMQGWSSGMPTPRSHHR